MSPLLKTLCALQKYSSKDCLQIGFPKPKENMISKEPRRYPEIIASSKLLTGKFLWGLCFNERRAGKINQPGNAFETGNFHPHWHLLHLWKITLQRDEPCLYPQKGKALTTQTVHFPIWRKLFQHELSSLQQNLKCCLYWTESTDLWVLFSCELFVCWRQHLIFFKGRDTYPFDIYMYSRNKWNSGY